MTRVRLSRTGSGRPVAGERRSAHAPVADAVPDWTAVEGVLAHLAETHATFPSATSDSNWISVYEPGRRLRLETETGSRWVEVASIRVCWETFERLRRIQRRDLLDPGRCSAFMMALFEQVAGVDQTGEGEAYLVLPPPG